jgi:hypothetical protein
MAWACGCFTSKGAVLYFNPGAKGGLSNWALADRQTGQCLGRHAAAYIHRRAWLQRGDSLAWHSIA